MTLGTYGVRYETLCGEMGTPCQRYTSLVEPTVYETIQRFVGPNISYIGLFPKGLQLMYSGEESCFNISKTLKKSQQH